MSKRPAAAPEAAPAGKALRLDAATDAGHGAVPPEAAAAASKKGRGGKFKKAAFIAKGYAVVKQLFSTEQVDSFRRVAKDSLPDQRLREQYNQKGDQHRYEYIFAPDPVDLAPMTKVIRTASPKLELSQKFCIVSDPGSQDQPWHTDSIPGPGSGLSDLEWRDTLHYIGVLTPLVSTHDDCGKTDVMVRSHLNTGATDSCHAATLALAPGDALILDGRTLHRGLGNRSERTKRTMCFFTYKLSGFEDGNAEAYLGGDRSDRLEQPI